MKIIRSFCLITLLFSFSVFSQTATKLDELGSNYHCGNALHRFIAFGIELKENPQNKLYVIYYEAQYRTTSVFNHKTKKFMPELVYPRFGDALNKAKEIPLYLKKTYKIPAKQVVLVDGGFRERFLMEIWSVPEGAEFPKATPTLERKDIKFSKGKPFETKDLANCYSNY